MSPIGRVFIVINLVLAAVFLGVSGFYLQQATSWKEQFESEQGAHGLTEEQYKGIVAQRDSELQRVNLELARSNEERSSLNLRLRSAEEENRDLKGRLTNMESRLTAIGGATSTTAQELENLARSNKELTDRFLAAERDRNQAMQARDEAEARLAAAVQENRMRDDRIAALASELEAKEQDVRKLAIEVELYRTRFPGALAGPAAPAIDGRVLAVHRDLQLATISVGEEAEVKAGYEFAVYTPQGTYKGDVVITDVSANNAFGRIVRQVPGATIEVGDHATTRFQ